MTSLTNKLNSQSIKNLKTELENFSLSATGKKTIAGNTDDGIPVFENEFWTARQRCSSSLHEISYRACFKPLLPKFFIERLTDPGDTVYDPFMGRGTTLIEGAILGRNVIGCDINPLSVTMIKPRLTPPALNEILLRISEIPLDAAADIPEELLVFYHPQTLHDICALKSYIKKRKADGKFDNIDNWIEMVAINRLTGHSSGFFSVYTMPPNQAVSVKSQIKINEKRNQIPPLRDIKKIIIKKTKSLMRHCPKAEISDDDICKYGKKAVLITGDCENTAAINDNSVNLIVTSPPFLDIVNYKTDNWLRCWFAGIDPEKIAISIYKSAQMWTEKMTGVFKELKRVLNKNGLIAFEVGEVHKGGLKMEELVIQAAKQAGLTPHMIIINSQNFTKTSNCWGIDNNSRGTNSNRIIILGN